MQEYEIRISTSAGQPSVVFTSMQMSDRIATDVARRLAGSSGFEVWREMACVCRKDSGAKDSASRAA